jgi:hypothetical protein
MGNEPPSSPSPRLRIGSQVEYDVLAPSGGIRTDFLALRIPHPDRGRFIDLILLVPERALGKRRVHIRLFPTIIQQDALRSTVFQIRDGYFYEIDLHGDPLSNIKFDSTGVPVPNTPGVIRCNGHVNLEVTQFDTKLGTIRVKRRLG